MINIKCDSCGRNVAEEKINMGTKVLNEIPIEKFEDIIETLGLGQDWQNAKICIECVEYYA